MTDEEANQICGRIAQARKEAGLTQPDMADRLHVDNRTYWNYEHGRVPWARLREIAEITGHSYEWIVHGVHIATELQGIHADLDELREMRDDVTQLSEQLERLLSHDSAEKIGQAVADPGQAGRGTPQRSSRRSPAKGKRQAGG